MKRVMMAAALATMTACGTYTSRQAKAPARPPVVLDSTTESTTTTTAPPPTTEPPTTLPTAPPTIPPTAPTPTTGARVAVSQQASAQGSAGGFQACVALRESGNNPHIGGGLYGILDSTWHSLGYGGHARDASVEQQNEAFARLYAMYGKSPWSRYDGC